MKFDQLTPQEAINILDLVTRPEHAGKLTRTDYARAESALHCLSHFVQMVIRPVEETKAESEPSQPPAD